MSIIFFIRVGKTMNTHVMSVLGISSTILQSESVEKITKGIHGSLMLLNDTAENVRSAAPYLHILTFSLKP